jgi:cytochrome c oxidase subunit 1
MALTIRAELFKPGLQIVDPEFFNSMTTLHGLIMIFGALMPARVGFANWLIPMQIGAPDMAFARMNNWSFWLLPFAAVPARVVAVHARRRARPGWTLYPPLSIENGMGMDLTIFAIHIMGASSIMGSINIITTILNLRAPGMTLMKMPLFCWTWLITAVPADRRDARARGRGDDAADRPPLRHVVLQRGRRRRPGAVPAHLLVLRAPEVYIIILPAFGIISEIIPTFSRKPLFGYASMVYALSGHRDPVVHRVGAPHVHDRPAGGEHPVLHVRDDADRRADRREGVQLARDDVEGLDQPRGADALRARLPVPVHARRLHRPGARDPADRRPVPGHRTTSSRTSTT